MFFVDILSTLPIIYIISFPTDQLHLTTHPPGASNCSSQQSQPQKSLYQNYPAVLQQPLAIPPRSTVIMTVPCSLPPQPGTYVFTPAPEGLAEHAVNFVPIIIGPDNDTLPAHFVNHSSSEVIIPKRKTLGNFEQLSSSPSIHTSYTLTTGSWRQVTFHHRKNKN